MDKLVYFETYDDVYDAIQREKRMKKWERAWKAKCIMEENPEWVRIIQPGVDKLSNYEAQLTDTHMVAMGKLYLIYYL